MRAKILLLGWLLIGWAAPTRAQVDWGSQLRDHDLQVRNFVFRTGERLPSLNLHYATLGKPRRDRDGRVTNAIMIMHGTGGSGRQFIQPHFADELFGPGAPLDKDRYFIILPDSIGHGRSSKPSDGLRTRFPAYDYHDMVEGQRRVLLHLGVRQARMMIGTSMGCMQIFVWAQSHPEMMRAAMPMACLPTEIAGHNRMWRHMAVAGIKNDPAWNSGNYSQPPMQGLRTAVSLLQVAGWNPLLLQREYGTREAAERYIEERVARDLPTRDANDLIYQLQSSRTYNPMPRLEAIRTPMTWINSADDFINPPGYGIAEQALRRMPTVRYRLIPASADTRGHGTHTWARFWKNELANLLAQTE